MQLRILFPFLVLLIACGSPQEAYEKQDYSKAYKLALAGLKKDKGDMEMRSILRRSLEQILETQRPESRRLAGTGNPGDWEQALGINYELQEQAREAHIYLPGAFEKDLDGLLREARGLRQRLYSTYYEQGRAQLAKADSTGLKQHAQQANSDFSKARQYAEAVPAGLDSLSKLAQRKGILYYHVETEAPFNIFYDRVISRVFEDVEDYSGGFLTIVYETAISNADCALKISFSSLDIDIDEQRGDEDYNQEVILEYQTVTDSSGGKTKAPVYGTVEGNVIIITKTKTATWEADVNIEALSPNCSLSGESFQAEASSVIREIRLSGDERAVPEQYLNAPKEEFMDEEEMVEQLLEDLFDQIARRYF